MDVRLETISEEDGCRDDTIFRLTGDSLAMPVVHDDQGEMNRCALIGQSLKSGSYELKVTGRDRSPLTRKTLTSSSGQ